MEPRNLLLIMSDQHNRNMSGCYGDDIVRTPNIDALAARGAKFDAAYTPCPVCVPARASFAKSPLEPRPRASTAQHPLRTTTSVHSHR